VPDYVIIVDGARPRPRHLRTALACFRTRERCPLCGRALLVYVTECRDGDAVCFACGGIAGRLLSGCAVDAHGDVVAA